MLGLPGHRHYLTRDDTIFTGMEARGKGVVGGRGGGYLVKCCVYISSCTNWSEGILSGDWERLEASNISPQLSLHNWKVCINNYVSALRCNSKRLQTSPPSSLLPLLSLAFWSIDGITREVSSSGDGGS